MKNQQGFTPIEFLAVLAVFIAAGAFSFSSLVRSAHATQAAQSSVCLITADVFEVTKERELILGSEFYPPGPDYYIDYYLAHLKISEISTFKKEPGWMGRCDRAYAQKVERNGAIIRLAEYQKSPIHQGQKIKGYLNFGGDERFHGDFLSGAQVLGEFNLPTPTLKPFIPAATIIPSPIVSPSIQPRLNPPTNVFERLLSLILTFLRKLQIWK